MLLRTLLKTLALPPTLNFVIILFALLFLGRWQRLRVLLIALSTASLIALSLPVTAAHLAGYLEVYPVLGLSRFDRLGEQDAIIVLGGGRFRDAMEYGGDVPRGMTLERLRYAAYIQRATNLPLLVTGGFWREHDVPESRLMSKVLEQDFSAKVSWQESRSRTTWENATLSRDIAEKEGIRRILLVTHAWHMPRAVYSFEQAGFKVTPAPTLSRSAGFRGDKVTDYMPSASALLTSSLMLHEMLGLVWYRWVN